MKKWIIIAIVIILIAVGGTWIYQKGKAKQEVTTIIPTAQVQKGTLESKVSGSGSLVPTTDEDIKTDESKIIDEVLVDENQTVSKGDELVTFTDGTDLVAPAAGTITSVNVYSGSRVNPGQVIAHLTNYKDLSTVIKVDELDIPDVKVGQDVNIIVNAFPDNKYTGKVTSIAKEGTVSNGVSSFDVTVHLTSSKNLKPGMTTTADIITNKKENTLFVPVEAVHKIGNTSYVLVESSQQTTNRSASNRGTDTSYRRNRFLSVGTGNGKRVEVKTGIHNDSYVEILSGLSQGQVVELPAIVRGNNSQNSNGSQTGRRMFGSGLGGGFGGNMGGFGGGRNFIRNQGQSSRGGMSR